MKKLFYTLVGVLVVVGLLGASTLAERNLERLTFVGTALSTTLSTALSAAVDSVTAHLQKAATATESQVACTSTDTQLIASNASRIGFIAVNQSPVAVFISYSATATTTNGIRLEENMALVEDHYTGEVSCITASGTATVGRKEY